MIREELAYSLGTYVAQAACLESRRRGIEEQLVELAKNEIVPAVAKRIVDPYSIDCNFVKIIGVRDMLPLPHLISAPDYKSPTLAVNEVPLGFCVDLRMLYNNKPIYHGSVETRVMYSIQKELAPFLDELVTKHKLVHINIGIASLR